MAPWIKKDRARTFVLVHAGADEGAPGKRVFKEVTKPTISEAVFEQVATLEEPTEAADYRSYVASYSQKSHAEWSDLSDDDGSQDGDYDAHVNSLDELYDDMQEELLGSHTDDETTEAELEGPARYGVYFEDAAGYDYMRHLRPIGVAADAVFVPAPKGAAPPAQETDLVRYDTTFKDDPEYGEVDIALHDIAYCEAGDSDDDRDAFFDVVLQGRQTDVRAPSQPQRRDEQAGLQADTRYLTQLHILDEPEEVEPIVQKKLTKRERTMERAVRTLDMVRQELKGVCTLPTGESEEETMDGEDSDVSMEDWNWRPESACTFVSLQSDDDGRAEDKGAIRYTPTLIEAPQRSNPRQKSSVSFQSKDVSEESMEEMVDEPRMNLGKARPKEETLEEKKARKQAVKLAKAAAVIAKKSEKKKTNRVN